MERTYLWRISVVRVLEIVAKLRPVHEIKMPTEYAGIWLKLDRSNFPPFRHPESASFRDTIHPQAYKPGVF